ncbi:DNA polymerase IV [Salinibacillus xinjiangensis]|uniref:DNA polymerase IV n=1 Tax=Salinibacillus xinjiangensis TaxID=1229268 RepID=A0A6G1X6H2_9BACI|nr:DNA polymerase IV [Salinibacillus xinjiangensis]MRG86505.1 DNA polymerase IV [Salinibacillus xinjiangensis]
MSSRFPTKGRIIFHVDMNSFYASVEAAYNPDLKGKPLAIAGNPEVRKGIIVTSSYEARAKGVKTTMPLWQAKDLCPELIVMRPNFDRYREASKNMFEMLAEVTPYIQPVSIDEGYMDITECADLGTPFEIAENIQKRIKNELDLPCSIGIAPNKFLAKMASDMKKPMGITVLRKRELATKLWPLPIDEMYGVGGKTAEKLRNINIETIGDLAKYDVYHLKSILGINGERLQNRANGYDPRPVDPDAVSLFKSIGNSQTLPYDTTDEREITKLLRSLSEKVAERMKRKTVVSENIQVMIRYHDRKTITRSHQLHDYVEFSEDIFNIASELFFSNWNGKAIRLLGVTAQQLTEKEEMTKQLDLFTYENEAKNENLYKVVDDLSEKYGKDVFKKSVTHEGNHSVSTSFQKDFLDDFKRD